MDGAARRRRTADRCGAYVLRVLWFPGGTRVLGGLVLAGALAVGLLPPWAGASQLADDEVVEDEFAGLADEDTWSPAGAGTQPGMALWFWPEGGRFFQLTARPNRFDELTAYDLQTRTEVGAVTLDSNAWTTRHNQEFLSSNGRHHTAAVDRERGRVFVAYQTGATDAGGMASGEAPCAGFQISGTSPLEPGCVGGVQVVDGASMESLGRIQLDLPTVEGPRAFAVPRALEWAPPASERGWDGRVLMLVEERTGNQHLEGSGLVHGNAPALANTLPRRNSGNVVYAVALDPASMRQEWVVRVEGCRNSREERAWTFEQLAHPMTVFRTGGADPALYVGCHGNPSQQGVVARIPLDADGVPAALPLRVGDPVASADPGAEDGGLGGLVEPVPRQEVFTGPDSVRQILSDPVSQRILMRVEDSGEVWWVFDGKVDQFIGTIGIGDYALSHTYGGLDPDTGRLYVLAATPTESNLTGPGGLYVADIRRDPLPQALHYPHLADDRRSAGSPLTSVGGSSVGQEMSVQPRAGGEVTRLFRTGSATNGRSFRVIADATEVSPDPEPDEVLVRTLDLDEAEGVTEATFDGTARGFGFRAILLGGVEGAMRVGPADPAGWMRGAQQLDGGDGPGGGVVEGGVGVRAIGEASRRVVPQPDPCTDAQREVIVAFVGPEGPAVVDASSSRGEAQPVLADVRTREDAEAPVTRCGPTDWPELWRSAMVSQPPASEPGVGWPFDGSRSSCTATDEDERESWSDPVAGAFASQVECGEDQVGGWGQARGLSVDGVSVANTLSSFRIYRDPQRGLVARVESVARGIDVGGVVRIDTIRGVAESWANGRLAGGFHQPDLERELGLGGDDDASGDPEAHDDGAPGEEEWNPFNCDTTRSAGTCFERHVFGVTVTNPEGGEVWRCGPCGPEDDFVEAMNRGFGAYGMARFREPDRELALGSADGYIAAVTKKDTERFADIVLNADLLETMVPMLEVIRYAPHNRQSGGLISVHSGLTYDLGTPPRGRQVYQFAAVEVSSTYSIQCLLEYDAATNVCTEPEVPASSLTVELLDGDGQPLAGGAFELRRDTDGDGVLGLLDELVEDGACATGPDGVCAFDWLEPGSYLVSQTAAPEGYAPVGEPLAVSLFPGDDLTVTFTNVPNVSVIALTVTDLGGTPVEGAVFGVFPDAGDGTVADGVEPVATCTTDADGVCAVTVPPGAYVLRQLSAPDGLLPIDDIAFVIDQPGQTADVALTLGTTGTDPVPVTEPAAGPVDDFAPVPAPLAQPAVSITPAPARQAPSVGSTPPAMSEPPPAIAEQLGGTIVQVIRAPAGALRLAARSPIEAASLVMVLLLVGLAVMAVLRRRQLATLLAAPASGGSPGTPMGGLARRSRGPGRAADPFQGAPAAPDPRPGAVGGLTAAAGPVAKHSAGPSGAEALSPREREVAALAAQGMGRSEIAARLMVSRDTVKGRLRRAREKLGVADPHDVELLRSRLRDHGVPDDDPGQR